MINTMLDNMDKNIRDIYQLQLSQKDANMRALQSPDQSPLLYVQYTGIYPDVCRHARARMNWVILSMSLVVSYAIISQMSE